VSTINEINILDDVQKEKEAVKAEMRKKNQEIDAKAFATFRGKVAAEINAILATADRMKLSRPKAYAAMYSAFRLDAAPGEVQVTPANTTAPTGTEVRSTA
jgi:hypothetical protein